MDSNELQLVCGPNIPINFHWARKELVCLNAMSFRLVIMESTSGMPTTTTTKYGSDYPFVTCLYVRASYFEYDDKSCVLKRNNKKSVIFCIYEHCKSLIQLNLLNVEWNSFIYLFSFSKTCTCKLILLNLNPFQLPLSITKNQNNPPFIYLFNVMNYGNIKV